MEFTEDIIDAMRKSFLTSQPKGDNSWRTVTNWERFLYEFRRRMSAKAGAHNVCGAYGTKCPVCGRAFNRSGFCNGQDA